MNLQKDNKIIGQNQECSWTLGNPKRTSRTESLNDSTAIYIDN